MGIWRDCLKIDAHVHVLPNERREELIKNYGSDGPWAQANIEVLLKKMDQYNILKCLLLPINDRYMYYDVRETNEFLASLCQKYPERFVAFADIALGSANDMYFAPDELEYAIKELGLKGVKIHPSNLNLPADDLRLVPLLRKAAELNVPVMYHSNPWGPGFYDMSSPTRINKMIKVFPDIDFITAHLGGNQVMDAINAVTYVDFSFVLLDLVQLYGIEMTNRILRKFGPSRLIFGTDFPEGDYELYFEILEQFDFTEDEVQQICYGNISKLLQLD